MDNKNEFLFDLKTPETTWNGSGKHYWPNGKVSSEAGLITRAEGEHGAEALQLLAAAAVQQLIIFPLFIREFYHGNQFICKYKYNISSNLPRVLEKGVSGKYLNISDLRK